MESSKTMREREAAALREWFSKQKRFGSWAAMERALKITKDYLRHIKSGEKRVVDPVLRAKLFETTGLDAFKPIKNSRLRKLAQRQRKDQQEISLEKKDAATVEAPASTQTSSVSLSGRPAEFASEKATKVRNLLVTLADELEFFKQQSEPTRRIFRKIVPGEDVGYITTLLRALYDEDQFQRWLLFSDHKLKSKETD